MKRIHHAQNYTRRSSLSLAAAAALLGLQGCGSSNTTDSNNNPSTADSPDNSSGSDSPDVSGTSPNILDPTTITSLARTLILGDFIEKCTASSSSTAKIQAQAVPASLSDVTNIDAYSNLNYDFNAPVAEALLKNLFVVTPGSTREFFQVFESNRYYNEANFITVDSMLHTYHLYFAYLMRTTEKTHLADLLKNLSVTMLETSRTQYQTLEGSEWESAALRNLAFFSVAASLQDSSLQPDTAVQQTVDAELANIASASAIETCDITQSMLDYSQFTVRGYYEGDATLESYFKAMMWYGQLAFLVESDALDDDLDKSALLMTLALNDSGLELWEEIYAVSSFFCGVSDDLSYYEYLPAVEAAYGSVPAVEDLPGNEEGWSALHSLTQAMDPPAINSVPTWDDDDSTTHANSANKGFRFMGQRTTIDETIFQRLVYDYVGENPKGEKRTLPDTLDICAALGSEAAFEILDNEGDTAYESYPENMRTLRSTIEKADAESWAASLYSAWLYTLRPLLDTKGEGYPSFMQSEAWQTKSLEAFSGSYAELKHDTILYAKQAIAEMGGDEIPAFDDRGYVEPEVEVWTRFAALADATAEGLKGYGLLSETDEENLGLLSQMATQFKAMSEKELSDTLLSDEEYDLIRNFGGNLEHLFLAVHVDDDESSSSILATDNPAAVIADIATDTSGYCLEAGIGCPDTLYVLAYFDSAYHICSGPVFSFYQFAQALSERLTDTQWREMVGAYGWENTAKDKAPSWTQSYRASSVTD